MVSAVRANVAIIAVALSVPAFAQPSHPPVVAKSIQENRKACAPDEPIVEPGFITRKDVNADGIADFILDYGSLKCGSGGHIFCGSAGCLTQVFASLEGGGFAKVLDENVQEVQFRRAKGRAAMILGVHGSACGRMGAEACEAILYWNDSRFSPAK